MGKVIRAYNTPDPKDSTKRPATPLPHARLHDLRHVHATLLLLAGVPVHVVAERLGHSDPAITLRIYAHVMRTHAAGVAGIFAAAAAQSEPANTPDAEDEDSDDEDGTEEAAGVPC
ncbi:tyrosine-type recombinase/integrase [Kribbella sp. NPDC005582]|uniref:tyrosine-type recombinase/integrase n=1 Tax=Kribbella sp. NPDC005582 TaxID=3156893 RepID=UPI0033AAADC1